MHAIDEDGWCEWIHPLPGYLMQCCDCGLIHEMQYAIVPSHENCGDSELNEGETKDGVIIFRARRSAVTPGVGFTDEAIHDALTSIEGDAR